MIVDTHIHPIADNLELYPLAPIGGQQSEWSKGVHLTDEQFLQLMAEAGVDKATLVQGSTVHGYDNRYLVECVKRHPDKFVGVCCINAMEPDAPDTLSYWIEEQGMRGIRLFAAGSTVAGNWLDDPQTFPMWERARALKIPVNVQTNAAGLPMVLHLLEHFGDVPMILDHMSGPQVEDGPPYAAAQSLLDLAQFPNISLKFTNGNLNAAVKGNSTVQALFELLIAKFGANRLLWGSNYPSTTGSPDAPYKSLVDTLRRDLAFLTPADRDLLVGGTAASLYPDLN